MVPLTFAFLLFTGVPIAIVLAMTAIVYIWASGNTVLFLSFSQQLYGGLEQYGLLAIPLFVLLGELMNAGGITRRLINFASVFVGSLRGGLAYINLLANMFMASIIGSTNAQIAVMGYVMVPEMERRGYDRAFAAAVTAAGGLMAPIIPPSMLFVIYGVLAQISIGDMFLAGVFPGLIMGMIFIAITAALGFFYTYPKEDKADRSLAISHIVRALPSLSIPVIIIGGIAGGIATPTESAAVAAVATIAIGWFGHREFSPRQLPQILKRLLTSSAMVLFMVATANVFGWIVVYEKIPQTLATWLQGVSSDPLVFMLLLNGLLLLAGMVIDAIAALILVVPILLPIAMSNYHIDPFQFGVVVCLNLVIGLLTPPVGTALYVAAHVSDVRPLDIIKPLFPFLCGAVVVLFLVSVWPALSLALL